MLCTVMFNSLEMPAHNTKMRKRHYSTTNMQKTLCFVSYLLWIKIGFFHGYCILNYIQSLSTSNKIKSCLWKQTFWSFFLFFPSPQKFFCISFIIRNYQWETTKHPSVQSSGNRQKLTIFWRYFFKISMQF